VTEALKLDSQEMAQQYRQLELERINGLLLKYLPAALEGNLKASEHVLRLSQFEADLTGSRMPVAIAAEVEMKPAEGKPDLSKLSIQELYTYRELILKTLGRDQPIDVVPEDPTALVKRQ
jgi:hypothetical protein